MGYQLEKKFEKEEKKLIRYGTDNGLNMEEVSTIKKKLMDEKKKGEDFISAFKNRIDIKINQDGENS